MSRIGRQEPVGVCRVSELIKFVKPHNLLYVSSGAVARSNLVTETKFVSSCWIVNSMVFWLLVLCAAQGQQKMRHFCKMAMGSLLMVILASTPALSDNSSANGIVEGFQASLLDVMKRAKKLGVHGRFEELTPIIRNRFHLPLMIATASAPYWKAGSHEQQSKLLAAFPRMSVSTLATLFDGYSEEYFRTERERKTSGRVVIVDTQIIRKKNDPVNISYVAVDMKDRW